MPPDFSPFFEKYENILAEVDAVFAKVATEFPDCVNCRQGCSDCCHALFDLPLIEALYLNHHFHSDLPRETRDRILEKADRADRESYKIKFQAHRNDKAGVETEAILEDVARKRVRCPLLNAQEMCDLYAYRPITCRLYGIPHAIQSKARTCALSGFEPGQSYPTVHIEKIHQKLAQLSLELVNSLDTKYTQMGDILVPPSMALLTVYDDDYLGIQTPQCSFDSCADVPASAGCTQAGECSSASACQTKGCGSCP